MQKPTKHEHPAQWLCQCGDWLPTIIVIGIWAAGAAALYQLLVLFAHSLGLPA